MWALGAGGLGGWGLGGAQVGGLLSCGLCTHSGCRPGGPSHHLAWATPAPSPACDPGPSPLPKRLYLVALDVSVLALQRGRLPCHVQLRGRGAVDGHVAGRHRGHWRARGRSVCGAGGSWGEKEAGEGPWGRERWAGAVGEGEAGGALGQRHSPASPTKTSWGALRGPSPTALYTVMRIS